MNQFIEWTIKYIFNFNFDFDVDLLTHVYKTIKDTECFKYLVRNFFIRLIFNKVGDEMIINGQQIEKNSSRIKISYKIENKNSVNYLIYEIDNEFQNLIDEKCDSALIAILIPAMLRGEDIYIKGEISARLFNSIENGLIELLIIIMPYLKKINIYPDRLSNEINDYGKGIATGFSGGVDSYSIITDHFRNIKNKKFNITHLLFNNVGSHGQNYGDLFNVRYDRLVKSAKKLNLPFIKINSNVDSFYNNKIDFQKTHSLRNASVGLLLQRGISCYFYASTYEFLKLAIKETYDIAYTDLVLLPLLSTEQINIISEGSQYSRIEKTLKIATMPETYHSLDVCVSINNSSGYTNCGKCWKCLRTFYTFDISNNIENYKEVFDYESYIHHKQRYEYRLVMSDDPLLVEIVKYADSVGYSFPLIVRIIRFLHGPIMYKYLKKCKKLLQKNLK